MTIKAVLFDVDGVIITNVYSFSKHMQKYYLDNIDDMQDFFNGDFRETTIGKEDLREILKPRLNNWNWKMGVDNFLKLWFLSESKTDSRILNLVSKLQKKSIICCIATNQEQHRKKFLLKELQFKEKFDKHYFSCDLQVSKPNEQYFQKIATDLHLLPEEILFIDDDEKNVEGAKSIGINVLWYQRFSDIEKNNFLSKYL